MKLRAPSFVQHSFISLFFKMIFEAQIISNVRFSLVNFQYFLLNFYYYYDICQLQVISVTSAGFPVNTRRVPTLNLLTADPQIQFDGLSAPV